MTTNNPSFYELISDDPPEQEVQEGFAVRDLQSADWCLAKALSAQKRINEIEAYAASRLEELNAKVAAYVTKETASYQRTVNNMAQFLEPWIRERLSSETVKDKKTGETRWARKSMHLLSGRVGFRKPADRLDVSDEAAAVADLKQLGRLGAIRTKEEVDKRALMADVKAGAPLPEGCAIVPGSECFYLDEGKEDL